MLKVDRHLVPNGDGWLLSLRRTVDDRAHLVARNPLLIIPGYGMNSFIFGFHPTGDSMEASLAFRGFEVWSVDLRAQGQSERHGGSLRYGLADLVLKDLKAAVDGVRERTACETDTVDLIGCSLGASMMFAYVACLEPNHAGRLVNMGGPVRWVKIHPAIRLAFASPWLVGMLPLHGVRRLCSVALPLLRHAPWLLSVYLHPSIVDLSQSDQIMQTVEDPNRHINRELAEWLRRKDLIIGGINVGERLRSVRNPLLTVIANADRIAPRPSVLWPHEHIGSTRKDILEVGTASIPIGHADMFVSRHAPAMVFEPLARWLGE